VLKPGADDSPGYALLEVKGPGDALRPEQRAWLACLVAQGLPAAVLRVRWSSPPALPRRLVRSVQSDLATLWNAGTSGVC
jgi:hypothetical protein